MKKIVLNISEAEYERFRFEAMQEGKSISEILKERIFYKPFSQEVQASYDNWLDSIVEKIFNE